MSEEMTFAGRLRELRERAGLTMYALAKRTGLSGQAISNLEGGAIPSWETVRLLAAALGVPITAFEVGAVQLPEVKPPRKGGRQPKRPAGGSE